MQHLVNYQSYLTLGIGRALGILICGLSLFSCGGSSENTGAPITPTTPVSPPVTPPSSKDNLNTEFTAYLTGLADQVLLPSYQALETQAIALQNQSSQFCALSEKTTDDLKRLQQAWLGANQAWQAIQWFKLGPILDESRALRIGFWQPGTQAIRNGVENLLLRQGEVIDAALIANVSTAAQGLPALEYLLYPEQQENSLLAADDQAKRCEIIQGISSNLAQISSQIYQAWQTSGGNYRQTYTSGTGEFLINNEASVQDAIEETVSQWLAHIISVKDNKIVAPLSSSAPGIRQRAEHYLSQTSLLSIQQNIQSYQLIYLAAQGSGFNTILESTLQQADVANQVSDNITALNNQIKEIIDDQMTLVEIIETDSGREKLNALRQSLNTLRDSITIELTQALDINLGFNATDGD